MYIEEPEKYMGNGKTSRTMIRLNISTKYTRKGQKENKPPAGSKTPSI
jgi:hypothetical protein